MSLSVAMWLVIKRIWDRSLRRGTDANRDPEPLPSLQNVSCIGPIDLASRVRMRRNWRPTETPNCRNCHFLAKRRLPIPSDPEIMPLEPWTGPERAALEIDQRDGMGPVDFVIKCERGFWGPEHAMPELDTTLEPLHDQLRRNRGETCFFVEYRFGMTFEAARELGVRQRANQQASKDRRERLITVGLSVCLSGLVAAAVSIFTGTSGPPG